MITYTNNLDIYPGNPPIVIKLSQYDTDFSLVFNLFSSRGTLTIASGTTAVFREKKPDGNVMSVNATIDITNKKVTLTPSDTIAKQITAIAGKCCCELSLQKNNDELNTANFVLLVEKAPVDIDEIPSDSVLRELYDVADRADEILEAAETVDEAIADLPNLIDPTLALENHAADAKAVGDRFLKEGLSDAIKEAFLNCFRHVAWADTEGEEYYESLATLLGMGVIVIKGTDLGNYSMWMSNYPYYTAESRRLTYYKLDISVNGGGIYKVNVAELKQNVNMYLNAYNQNTLDHYDQHAQMVLDDKMDLFGGWLTDMNQDIVIPKYINGSPSVGLVFGFKYSDNSNIGSDAIDKVTIKEIVPRTLPPEYRQYDYIAGKGSGNTISTNYTGLIKTAVYDDLSQTSVYLDYKATNSLGTSNAPILGMRGGNDWTSCICIYITSATNYTIYSLVSNTFKNLVVKNRITHIDLRQGTSMFVENGSRHSLRSGTPVVVNAPLCLFANPINGVDHNSIAVTNNVQLGQFVIQYGEELFDVYVPAVRISDNVIGIFNLTNQTFYTCQDVTKATIGNTNCIYQVGNWT